MVVEMEIILKIKIKIQSNNVFLKGPTLNIEQIVTSVPDFASRCHIGH